MKKAEQHRRLRPIHVFVIVAYGLFVLAAVLFFALIVIVLGHGGSH